MPNIIVKTDRSVFVTAVLVLVSSFFFSACSERDDMHSKRGSATMKCGAGKCGANMFEGSSALMKKKKNILSQMDANDLRRECVLKARTTKAVYDCVRDTTTGRLIRTETFVKEREEADASKKCGAEKCGGKM